MGKLERTNARALRFVYNDRISSYEALLGLFVHLKLCMLVCKPLTEPFVCVVPGYKINNFLSDSQISLNGLD